MAKVLALVEGQTEETFMMDVLYPYLAGYNVFIQPILVTTKRVKRGTNFRGGVPPFATTKSEILRLLRDSSVCLVTTMFDFYGLPASFPRGECEGGSAIDRVQSVERAIAEDVQNPRFFPYCSLHEFEALLFSSPEKISEIMLQPTMTESLQGIRNQFASPEDIDDSPETAPSRRLRALFPEYNKVVSGTQISLEIGLDRIRGECGHFDEWLSRLENP